MTSPILNDQQRKLLVKLRSKMLVEVSSNFPKSNPERKCPLKCNLEHLDTQENLLICPIIKENVNLKNIKYSYIFSDTEKQKEAAKVFKNILEFREKYTKKSQNVVSSEL